METCGLTSTVCRLVAYLVANVVKDEREYQDWGLPFIALSIEAQFGKEGAPILDDLHTKFCPLIGHGFSLILEDPEWEDYTFVHSAEVFLSSILDETETNDVNFESTLKQYMDNFFRFILSESSDDIYDARTRVIARRMCDALSISAAEFGELESMHWQSVTTSSSSSEIMLPQKCEDEEGYSERSLKSLARKKFHERFNLESKKVPASSILASFRIWRVAFIAAGGGALMALSGRLAAPAIMNTVLPLICASTTVGQLSFALSTTLSCFGVTSLELIPGIMSSYGATIAGRKMLNRTAPLKDFALKPLHLEVSEKIQRNLHQSKDSQETQASSPAIGEEKDSSPNAVPTGGEKPHAPVFILVSGHMERGVDARQLWGANGFLHSVVDTAVQAAVQATTVAVSEVVETVEAVSSNTAVVDSEGKGMGAGASDADQASTAFLGKADGSPEKIGSNTAECVVAEAASAQAEDTNEHQHHEQLTDWEELPSAQGGWWRESITHGEEYVLQWEPGVLERLNDSLQKILIDKMVGKLKGMVKGEILKFTPIPSIRAAATLPLMVMDKINELDDPWVIAMDRAHQAGKLLARVLLAEHRRHLAETNTSTTDGSSGMTKERAGEHTIADKSSSTNKGAGKDAGNDIGKSTVITDEEGSAPPRLMGRPITLVGYGMGARLVFHCLETLAAEGGEQARGIVENAVLIGSPVSMEHSKWAAARSVVAGRLINCYAWNDWLLALLYRSKSYEIGVAGLYPIHLQHASSSTAATTATAAPASSGTAHHFENSAAAKVAGVKGMKEIAVNNSEQGDAGDKKITKNECFHCKEEVDDAAATGTEAVTTEAEGNLPGGVEARHIKRRLHHCSAHEVENFDVSHLISSHSDYPNVLPAIITLLNL